MHHVMKSNIRNVSTTTVLFAHSLPSIYLLGCIFFIWIRMIVCVWRKHCECALCATCTQRSTTQRNWIYSMICATTTTHIDIKIERISFIYIRYTVHQNMLIDRYFETNKPISNSSLFDSLVMCVAFHSTEYVILYQFIKCCACTF